MRGQTVNVWNSQTGNLLPADFRASPYLYFAAHFVILSGVKCRMFDHVKAEQ